MIEAERQLCLLVHRHLVLILATHLGKSSNTLVDPVGAARSKEKDSSTPPEYEQEKVHTEVWVCLSYQSTLSHDDKVGEEEQSCSRLSNMVSIWSLKLLATPQRKEKSQVQFT